MRLNTITILKLLPGLLRLAIVSSRNSTEKKIICCNRCQKYVKRDSVLKFK